MQTDLNLEQHGGVRRTLGKQGIYKVPGHRTPRQEIQRSTEFADKVHGPDRCAR